jgi:hypothetical protein
MPFPVLQFRVATHPISAKLCFQAAAKIWF